MAPRQRKAPTQEQRPPQINTQRPRLSKSRPQLLKKLLPVLFWLVLLFGIASLLGAFYFWSYLKPQPPSCLLPFDAPSVKETEIFHPSSRRENLWGTFRPGLYFGVRTKLPSSLLGGLMWVDPSDINNINHIRHLAQQEDNIRYGWTEHNGQDYGTQTIEDESIDATIQTTWIRRSEHWSTRVSVTGSKPIAFFFYLANESGPDMTSANALDWESLDEKLGADGRQLLRGRHAELGKWHLAVHSPQLQQLHFYESAFPLRSFHNITEALSGVLYESLMYQYHQQVAKDVNKLEMRLHDPPLWLESSMEHPNFAVFQISGTPPFEFEMVFLGGSEFSPSRFQALVGSELDKVVHSRSEKFHQEFEKRWPHSKSRWTQAQGQTMTAGLSNLLGGVGYFYGASKVRVPVEEGQASVEENFRTSLLTAVPSRSFFPRGFLWDEGFHLLLIQKWNPVLCKEILAHWLDLMSSDGWIPREQILGDEARSRVPEEFVVQDPSVGNPPTLFLPLLHMARQNDIHSRSFLSRAWPRLVKWFDWIVENHEGKKQGTFRWTSRNSSPEKLNALTLDSGLDDYPRASHPSEDEYHLDIRCWIALAAEAMTAIGQTLDKPDSEIERYRSIQAELRDLETLKKLHLDRDRGWFLDYGLHTESVSLEKREIETPRGIEERVERLVRHPPRLRWIPSFGYVSLFPFFMKMFSPNDPLLSRQLYLIQDPDLLWTDCGLRSLARNSSFYQQRNTEHDPPYWRGAIWINMNFMALEALQHYSDLAGPYAAHARRLHGDLKGRLLQTIVREYERTGFLWEQYDDSTGEGKGCRPFTGWTSLILMTL